MEKQKSILTAAAAVLLAHLAFPAMVRADSMRKDLEEGKILTVSVGQGEGVKAGRSMVLIPAPATQVHKVIAAMEKYRHFVPNMVGSRQVQQGQFRLHSKMPWPATDVWAQVRVRAGQRNGTWVVAWSMEQGNFKKFQGTAWVQPAGKDRSVLTYEILAVPETIAPDALLTKGMKVVSRAMADAIRERAVGIFEGKIAPGSQVASK